MAKEDRSNRYFALFPKDTHNPYGEGFRLDQVSDDALTRKFNSYTNYWLSEPIKGLSTLASTLWKSTNVLTDLDIDKQGFWEFLDKLHDLAAHIRCLDAKEKAGVDVQAAFEKLESFLDQENVKYWHLVMSNLFLPLAHLLSAQWAMNGVGTEDFKVKCKPHTDQRDFAQFLKLKSRKRTFKTLFTMCCEPSYSTSRQPAGTSSGKSIFDQLTPRKRRKISTSEDDDEADNGVKALPSDSDPDEEPRKGKRSRRSFVTTSTISKKVTKKPAAESPSSDSESSEDDAKSTKTTAPAKTTSTSKSVPNPVKTVTKDDVTTVSTTSQAVAVSMGPKRVGDTPKVSTKKPKKKAKKSETN